MLTAVQSDYKIVLGAAVLVDVNDYLWGDEENILRITPEFVGVEAVPLVGGGGRMFEHAGTGNRFHTLEFTRVRFHSDVTAAKRFQLQHFADLPAGGVDLTITLNGYSGSATLSSAAIIAAPIFTLHQLSIVQYSIKGGRLASSLTLDTHLLDETGDQVLDETGVAIEQNP